MEIILQIIIISFGNISFHIVDNGLSAAHWGICIGFSAITFIVSLIAKFIFIDVFLDSFLSPEEKEPEFDPIAPEILECLDDKIKVKKNEKEIESNRTNTLNDEEMDMMSEEFNIKLGEKNYDFNKKDNNIIIVNEKTDDNNNLINSNEKISAGRNSKKIEKNESEKDNVIEINTENKFENNIDNDINLNIKEEIPAKKYKITNLGRNVMNLSENYSTDDEDEFNFINLINCSNEDYELAADSKQCKVYAKVVSNIKNI